MEPDEKATAAAVVAKYQETQHRLSFWAGKKAQVAEAAKAVLEAQKAREAALALGVEDPDKEANLRQAAVALHQAKTQVAASEVEVAAADASRVEADANPNPKPNPHPNPNPNHNWTRHVWRRK